jgi:hypothetical protein
VLVNALVFGYILFWNELTALSICKASIPSPTSIPFGIWARVYETTLPLSDIDGSNGHHYESVFQTGRS